VQFVVKKHKIHLSHSPEESLFVPRETLIVFQFDHSEKSFSAGLMITPTTGTTARTDILLLQYQQIL
jgi:hypothetical protein